MAEHFRRSCETLSCAADDPHLRATIHDIAEMITTAFRGGPQITDRRQWRQRRRCSAYCRRIPVTPEFRPQPAACHRVDHRQFGSDRDRQRLWVRSYLRTASARIGTAGRRVHRDFNLGPFAEHNRGFEGGARGRTDDHWIYRKSRQRRNAAALRALPRGSGGRNAPHSANPYCGGARDLRHRGKLSVFER